MGVSTRFHHSILLPEEGGGTLALVGSRCLTLGEQLQVVVCCPFGLPRKIVGLLENLDFFSWSFY